MPEQTLLAKKEALTTTTDEAWMARAWRPYMAFAYMAVILFDFIIGPFSWSIFQIIGKGAVSTQWVPLTLTSGGVFHAAMGAVLGISVFTRGQEKLQRIKTLEELQAEEIRQQGTSK